LAAGTIDPRPQGHEQASSAPMLKREDGRIDWSRSAKEIFNRVRGFAPWPGAHTSFRGQTCHIWGEPASNELGGDDAVAGEAATPGTLVVLQRGQKSGQNKEVMVHCGSATYLRLISVKLEGRKQVSAVEFANGAHLLTSEHFGES
jgi:methionyl-tRNA formyltransferase